MGLIESLRNRFKNRPNNAGFADYMNGTMPIYSQYGQNVYASDVVQQAISCIATEISKLQPRHIRIEQDEQKFVTGPLNRLFKFGPNDLMTTRDFLEKITWMLYLNYNVFLYPEFGTDDTVKAIWPLQPHTVNFLQDPSGRLFVEMHFRNGTKYTLPYDRVIHWRYRFSVNEFMGGNDNGQPDTAGVLQTVVINQELLNGVAKSIRYSMQINGILKTNSFVDQEEMKAEIARFEKNIEDSKSAILPIDLKSEYTPIRPDPKVVDPEILAFIDGKILRHYGVSVPVLTGDFNDEQYQAFYEKTLEPLILSLGQCFTKTLFSQRELDFSNEVIFYPSKLLFTNTSKKVAIADILGNRGAMTNNQLLDLFGYPPYPEGNVRLMSLNYVDVKIANQYQMNKAKAEGGSDHAKQEK